MDHGVDSAGAQGANHNDPTFRAVGISLALASGKSGGGRGATRRRKKKKKKKKKKKEN